MIGLEEPESEGSIATESRNNISTATSDLQNRVVQGPRIALLTPYSGGNLGDAAIQDAMIANIRARIPGSQFSGISLNNENFLNRHGSNAFSLCAVDRPFYSMPRDSSASVSANSCGFERTLNADQNSTTSLKKSIKKIRLLGPLLAGIVSSARTVWHESRHTFGAYRFLRTQDLVIVSGGGQLDEEWGGPWGHPFALFKWSLLAKFARVPFVIASVGACKLSSRASRFFVKGALRRASFESFRDPNSAAIAKSLLHSGVSQSVVPDIAFSITPSEMPAPANIAALANGRRIIAISPIVFAKPGSWPHEDQALYDRYLNQMALVVSQLLERNFFLIFVRSSNADKTAVTDLLSRVDSVSKQRVADQILVPDISTWRDLLALLQDADLLVASRLHSVILGFVAGKPSVAISFDPKVDWVMQDLGQSDYLLQIETFTGESVIAAIEQVQRKSVSISQQINTYKQCIRADFDSQYNSITSLAPASRGA